MAMKLQVYLKRTEQTLEQWLKDNQVSAIEELIPRCTYVGLSVEPSDLVAVNSILSKNITKAEVSSIELESVEVVEQVRSKKKKVQE